MYKGRDKWYCAGPLAYLKMICYLFDYLIVIKEDFTSFHKAVNFQMWDP